MATHLKLSDSAEVPDLCCGALEPHDEDGRHAVSVDPEIKERNLKRLRRTLREGAEHRQPGTGTVLGGIVR